MKAIGLIILLISLAIALVVAGKQKNTKVKTTILAPSGKEVQITELPTEVKSELETLNKQNEKRLEESHQDE
jgi:hypothetical protein